MRILFNDFKKLYKANKTGVDKSIHRVLDSGWFILGKEVLEFEKEFGSYTGSKHTIGVANGLEALQIGLLALGIGPGDEVITTAHSAAATALSILAVGAKPVFVDLDDFYHLDVHIIEKHITKKTKAVIPVHLYGQPVDMKKIMTIAAKHKLFVVEDCAQAHGATYQNKKVGTIGTLGCFSFYPTKNLGAFGDAGAIVTNDPEIAEKCAMIRNYGQKNRYEHEMYGINSRLDELQAGILRTLLKNLDKNNKKRVQIATLYKKQLAKIPELVLPKERPDSTHVYHLFVIKTNRRDELKNFLKDKSIDTLIHYPIPLHKQKSFAKYNKLQLKKTENTVQNILSLPIHPYLKNSEVLYVCKQIQAFFKS